MKFMTISQIEKATGIYYKKIKRIAQELNLIRHAGGKEKIAQEDVEKIKTAVSRERENRNIKTIYIKGEKTVVYNFTHAKEKIHTYYRKLKETAEKYDLCLKIENKMYFTQEHIDKLRELIVVVYKTE